MQRRSYQLAAIALVTAAAASAHAQSATPAPAAAAPSTAPATAPARPAAPGQAAPPPATYSAELAQTPPTADAAAAGAEDGQSPVRDAHVGLFVNSLGILQFGLSPTVEYGSKVAVNARALLLNTGVLSYVTAGNDTLHFSAGFGPGVRYYFGKDGNLRGAYVGGFGLYLSEEEQYRQETRYNTTDLVVGAEGGYRWVFHSGFLLGAGAMAGYAVVLGKSSTSLDGNIPDANNAANQPFGMLTLDLGFVI